MQVFTYSVLDTGAPDNAKFCAVIRYGPAKSPLHVAFVAETLEGAMDKAEGWWAAELARNAPRAAPKRKPKTEEQPSAPEEPEEAI